MQQWTAQEPKVRKVLGVHNGDSVYDPEAKVEELKTVAEFEKAIRTAGVFGAAVCFHTGN